MLKRSVIKILVEIGYALVVTFAAGKWSFNYAYLERGYKAVGGEYLFVLTAYWMAYKAIHYLIYVLEEMEYERRCKKRRSRGTVGVQNHR